MKVFLTTTAAVLALAAPTWAASFSELDANGDGILDSYNDFENGDTG